jgi:hypothetical protein
LLQNGHTVFSIAATAKIDLFENVSHIFGNDNLQTCYNTFCIFLIDWDKSIITNFKSIHLWGSRRSVSLQVKDTRKLIVNPNLT